METQLLNKEVQNWIKENYKRDIPSLVLKGSPFENISVQELAEQLLSKKKAEKKLPTWFGTDCVIFPKPLSIEQTSSEKTAHYKASIVSGESLLDLTLGFGVDTFYFSKKVKQLTAVEKQQDLAEKVAHNFKLFGIKNVLIKKISSEEFLEQNKQMFNWIYLDPARRDERKNKVFKLSDCEPNILALKAKLFRVSKNIMIKTSPMLDITQGLIELENVKEIHVVCLNNEVKELLWVLSNEYNNEKPTIKIVELKEGTAFISEHQHGVDSVSLTFSNPLDYIYQPHVGFLKTGFADVMAKEYNLNKMEVNTQLYTSNTLVKNYKGRVFKTKLISLYNKKDVSKRHSKKQYHVVSKNFPLSADELKKTIKLNGGGEDYLIFFKGLNNKKYVVESHRVY